MSWLKAPFAPPAAVDIPGSTNPDVLSIAAQLRAMRMPGSAESVCLLVTPATPGMSAALLVAELATTLPQLNEAPVLVVDLGLSGRPPLYLPPGEVEEVQISNETAVAEPAWSDEICRSAAGSRVVYARLKSERASILTSAEFGLFVARARRSFRYILIQGAAPQESVESILAAYFADGVVLTVGANQTSVEQARHAQKLLARTGARLLGFVYDRNPPTAQRRA